MDRRDGIFFNCALQACSDLSVLNLSHWVIGAVLFILYSPDASFTGGKIGGGSIRYQLINTNAVA